MKNLKRDNRFEIITEKNARRDLKNAKKLDVREKSARIRIPKANAATNTSSSHSKATLGGSSQEQAIPRAATSYSRPKREGVYETYLVCSY